MLRLLKFEKCTIAAEACGRGGRLRARSHVSYVADTGARAGCTRTDADKAVGEVEQEVKHGEPDGQDDAALRDEAGRGDDGEGKQEFSQKSSLTQLSSCEGLCGSGWLPSRRFQRELLETEAWLTEHRPTISPT